MEYIIPTSKSFAPRISKFRARLDVIDSHNKPSAVLAGLYIRVDEEYEITFRLLQSALVQLKVKNNEYDRISMKEPASDELHICEFPGYHKRFSSEQENHLYEVHEQSQRCCPLPDC